MPSAVRATSTVSMVARISAPMASSVMPNDSSIARWPSAFAPPWLPMAGTTNGSAPSSRKPLMTPRMSATRSVRPRLPPPTATVIPGVTLLARRSTTDACALAATSPTGSGRGTGSSTSVSAGTLRSGWNGSSTPCTSCSQFTLATVLPSPPTAQPGAPRGPKRPGFSVRIVPASETMRTQKPSWDDWDTEAPGGRRLTR
jgi:hypothetical protein